MNIGTAIQAIYESIAPDAINITVSRSGSAYVSVEVNHGIVSQNTAKLYFRVSDHPHPSTFNGNADLFGNDAEGVEKIKEVCEKLENELYPPYNGRGGAG